ncbi:hypothetical protein Ancab_038753 [Ancistrocladus abbreviatus]
MAGVSYLPLPEIEEEEEEDEEPGEILTLGSIQYWSHIYASDSDPLSSFDHRPQIPIVQDTDIFDSDLMDRSQGPATDTSESDSIDLFDRENQVNFVLDLFQQRVEQSHVETDRFVTEQIHESSFGVIEENGEMGIDCLESELGLGLALDFGLEDDDNCGGFIVSDCGDEFLVARRDSTTEGSGNLNDGDRFSGGLRVVGIESDSEEDENDLLGIDLHSEDDYAADNVNDDDLSIPLYWDSFHLEDHRDGNDEFEWEEVDGRVDEREVLSAMVDPEEEESLSVLAIPGPEEEEGGERERGLGTLEWEVLLNVRNLERNPEIEGDGAAYLGHHDDYIYTAEYEMMFGQFGGDENGFIGRPPASKSVIENLPSVVMTQEDVLNNNALCAVCKDEIDVGEQVKQLPCSHRYHGECIIPWLGIRNTCPVCRYELLTDDPDYERRRRTQ